MSSYKKNALSKLSRAVRLSLSVILSVGVSGGVLHAVAQESGSSSSVVVNTTEAGDRVNENGYRVRDVDESEFDNYSNSHVVDWRKSDPEYEDTEFGELMYNEASTPTKLEVLRLLSKDTPSITVFMHAISMGLDIEEVLKAAVKYEPNNSSDFSASAVSLLPVLTEGQQVKYSGYELEDLEREDETQPYKVQDVIDNFFDDRLVLRPYPDWFEGQYHFLASAAELKTLQEKSTVKRWYRSKSTQQQGKRPIFVSLYEGTKSVMVDSTDRIKEALLNDPNAVLPVVFVFNRINERAIDELGYPATIRGAQSAYTEKNLMVTPVPEWQTGEYHMYATMDEVYEIFNIPEEQDFEPEQWQKLLAEAEDYAVTDTAFLMVVMSGGDKSSSKNQFVDGQQYAAWDDPRSEAEYQYVKPEEGAPLTLENIVGDGIIINRPDLIAALNVLGVERIPVAFYYLDSSRVKPYFKGPGALYRNADGVIRTGSGGGNGGFTECASPPCFEPG